jgi:hypothetical protein
MVRETLKVGQIVSIIFGAFRGRLELQRTAGALRKNDKKFKINHLNQE